MCFIKVRQGVPQGGNGARWAEKAPRHARWAVVLCAGLWMTLFGWTPPAAAAPRRARATRTTEPAQPKESKADAEAREEFEAGRAAYEAGDYRLAWEHFRQAYLLSKRPQLLYNVGQAADRMGRDQDALTAFRMYLDQMPDAENRREVENRVRALEQRVKAAEMTPAPPPGQGWAEPQEDTPTPSPIPDGKSGDEAPPDPDQPGRHGWYFRGALGLSAIADAVSNDATKGTLTALGLALDLAAGYPIIDGLVIGGALMGNFSPAGSQSQDGLPTVALDGVSLWMLGPMVDWYLDPHRNGFHMQGALMLSTLSVSQPAVGTTVGLKTASGGALVVGVGLEFPFTSDLAWGILGRVSLARLGEAANTHNVATLSVLGSITWY